VTKVYSAATFNASQVLESLFQAIAADTTPLVVVIGGDDGAGGAALQRLIELNINLHHAGETDVWLELIDASNAEVNQIIRTARGRNKAVSVYFTAGLLELLEEFLAQWGGKAAAIVDTRIPSWMPVVEI